MTSKRPGPLSAVLASPRSGDGKTTMALALARFLGRRGLTVLPCTCGANPTDGALLAKACDAPCLSLDTRLMGDSIVRARLAREAELADAVLIEGNGGLLEDGAEGGTKASGMSLTKGGSDRDGVGSDGAAGDGAGRAVADPTLSVAALLRAPLVLVVDASLPVPATLAQVEEVASLCAAAGVTLFGVLANRVESQAHRRMLETHLAKRGLVPLLLCLGPLGEETLPLSGISPVRSDDYREWHREGGLLRDLVRLMGDDTHRLLGELRYWHAKKQRQASDRTPEDAPKHGKETPPPPAAVSDRVVRPGGPHRILAVALDDVFCLYFAENLDLLRRMGWEVVFFSPCEDRSLPAADALYIGDGWPGFCAAKLSENTQMRTDVRLAAEEGVPVYAEGAGVAWLARELETGDGRRFPMCGVLDLVVRVDDTVEGAKRRRGKGITDLVVMEPASTQPFGLDTLSVTPLVRGHRAEVADFEPDPSWRPLYVGARGKDADRPFGFVTGPRDNVAISSVRAWFPSLPDGAQPEDPRDEPEGPQAKRVSEPRPKPAPCVVMFTGPLRIGRAELMDRVSAELENRGRHHVRVSLEKLVDSVQNPSSRRVHLKQTEALGLFTAHDYHLRLRREAESHGLVLCTHVLCGRVDWMLDLKDTLEGVRLVIFELHCDIQTLFAREKDSGYRSGMEEISMEQAHDQEELPLSRAGILPCTGISVDDPEGTADWAGRVMKELEREEVFSRNSAPARKGRQGVDACNAWMQLQERRPRTLREHLGG